MSKKNFIVELQDVKLLWFIDTYRVEAENEEEAIIKAKIGDGEKINSKEGETEYIDEDTCRAFISGEKKFTTIDDVQEEEI